MPKSAKKAAASKQGKKRARVVKGGSDLTTAEVKAIAKFRREMTDLVIPEIARVVADRRELASKSRLWQLKT